MEKRCCTSFVSVVDTLFVVGRSPLAGFPQVFLLLSLCRETRTLSRSDSHLLCPVDTTFPP